MSEPRQLQLQVEGLANLKETLKKHEGKKIIVMFIGSMCEEGDHIGESWCPDCRDGRHTSCITCLNFSSLGLRNPSFDRIFLVSEVSIRLFSFSSVSIKGVKHFQ